MRGDKKCQCLKGFERTHHSAKNSLLVSRVPVCKRVLPALHKCPNLGKEGEGKRERCTLSWLGAEGEEGGEGGRTGVHPRPQDRRTPPPGKRQTN